MDGGAGGSTVDRLVRRDRRLAELHMGNQSLKSVSGHSRDEEVATYTREVDQARMADHAMAMLSERESGQEKAAPRALAAPSSV